MNAPSQMKLSDNIEVNPTAEGVELVRWGKGFRFGFFLNNDESETLMLWLINRNKIQSLIDSKKKAELTTLKSLLEEYQMLKKTNKSKAIDRLLISITEQMIEDRKLNKICLCS